VAVSTDYPHHGTYGFTSSLDSGIDAGWANLYESITYDPAYMRVENARFTNFPDDNGKTQRVLGFGYGTSSGGHTYAGVYNDNGTMKWFIRYLDDGWAWHNAYQSSGDAPQEDTNYTLELAVGSGDGDGWARLYVDGELLVEATGIDNDTISLTHAWLGFAYSKADSGETADFYADCAVIADTYIGPETTEQTYTKTWTTDALFKKLDKLESFGVDVDFFKRNVIKSFALDACFGALMTQTISRKIDVLLKRLDATKTFGLNAHFGQAEAETYARTFGLDIIFAYKVRLPELWLDENGKLVLNISKPYTWVGT
jgi:hypothetical protein